MTCHSRIESNPDAVLLRAAGPLSERLCLGTADAADAPPAVDLLDPDRLAGRLDALQDRYATLDRCAVASTLVKRHASAVLPGMLAAWAWGGIGLDVASGRLRFDLDVPTALIFDTPAFVAPERFLPRLFAEYFAPLYAAVHRQTRLSERVMWSNAGNVAAWTLGTLADKPDAPPAVAAAYRDLFESDEAPWRPGPNPMRDVVSWTTLDAPDLPPRVHRRRLCCLRWRLDERYCYSCPRISHDERLAILRASH